MTSTNMKSTRDQVGNIGVDVAMLEETLQNLAAQTEEANSKIVQVTNFVVDLIERLEDIDDKARSLLDKWKEESQAITEFTEHADEMTERFSVTVRLQEEKMCQLTELLGRLEGETKRLSFIPTKGGNPKDDDEAEEVVKNLLVDDPENVDFHAKRKAFFVIGEKMKTNDTYQTFKKAKKTESLTGRWSSTCSLEKSEGAENSSSQNVKPGNIENETEAETTSNENTAAQNISDENKTTPTESDQNTPAASPPNHTTTVVNTQPSSDKGNSSFALPLLLCILIALVACLITLVVNPDAPVMIRTYVNELTSANQNGNIAT